MLDAIQAEAESKSPLETGGLLAGYVSANDEEMVVTDIVGPGPKAKHRTWTFQPDYDYHRREIKRIFGESDRAVTYLGDWHSHPGALSYMSLLDKRALRNIARFTGNYIDRPIMLVLGSVNHEKMHRWTTRVWRISPLTHKSPWLRWEYIEQEIVEF